MSNELFIEISGSSNKAVSALDKVIAKLTEFQNKLTSATPKINQFNNSLKNMSFSDSFKKLTNDINTVSSALSRTDGTSRLSVAMKKPQSLPKKHRKALVLRFLGQLKKKA